MNKMVKSKRNVVLSTSAATESGVHLAEGSFTLKKTDAVLTSTDFGTSGHGGWRSIAEVHVAILHEPL